jgi:ribosomal protein S18 acetylase RimI-like enzyme
MPPPTIEPARPEELPAAFGLLFRHLKEPEREARIGNALRLLRQGELDPAGVFVARGPAGLLGAIVCLPVPGASGLVWPPQAADGARREEVEDRLLGHAVARLRQRGARLGQALLAADEEPLAGSLERNGFRHVTGLWYLRHDLDLPPSFLRQGDRLEYQSYPDSDPAVFGETLARTYEGTLDCPEVTGVRTTEEVIDGHRAQGVHDPARWWLARDGGRPLGVLLLTAMPEWQSWDVIYVGVVPEARRQGWGRELMHKALRSAHAAEVPQVTLSVDARNRPAWTLYSRLGFEPYDRREVYLAIWR